MKSTEEVKALRETAAEEIETKIAELEEELMKLRFRQASGQLDNSAQLGATRKSIARAKTILNEQLKEQGALASESAGN